MNAAPCANLKPQSPFSVVNRLPIDPSFFLTKVNIQSLYCIGPAGI